MYRSTIVTNSVISFQNKISYTIDPIAPIIQFLKLKLSLLSTSNVEIEYICANGISIVYSFTLLLKKQVYVYYSNLHILQSTVNGHAYHHCACRHTVWCQFFGVDPTTERHPDNTFLNFVTASQLA